MVSVRRIFMLTWSITLHGPAGIISTIDTGEAQFVVGTETAPDVFTVACEGIMPRHAWVWISEAGLQVEDLGGGTLVNGYQITERVQVEYPASVQVGEVTLVIEVKLVQPVAVSPTPNLSLTHIVRCRRTHACSYWTVFV